jgi:hypothetical protein
LLYCADLRLAWLLRGGGSGDAEQQQTDQEFDPIPCRDLCHAFPSFILAADHRII